MKKIVYHLSILVVILGVFSSRTHAQSFIWGPNLVLNPSFEDAKSSCFGDAFYTQVNLPISQRMVWVRNWQPGYTYKQASSPPFDRGGAPMLFDYSQPANIGCNYAPPNRYNINTASTPATYPVGYTATNNANWNYAHLWGGFDPGVNGNIDEGESILGELSAPLCPGTYEVKVSARVPYYGCSSCPVVIPDPNCTVEVVLRIAGDYNSELLLTTTPQLTQANWTNHVVLVTLTAAQIAAGYDRIEIRMNNQGGVSANINEMRACFVDEVGLRMRYPATQHVAAITCDQTIDLSNYETNCNETVNWEDNQGNPIPTKIASPNSNNTYFGYCTDASGCISHVDVVNVTVNQPQIGNHVYEICAPTMVNPPNTCGQTGVISWSWVINNAPPVLPADPNGAMPLSPGDQGSVTVTYANGCVCITNFSTASPLFFDLAQNLDVCYGDIVTLDAFFDPIASGNTINWDGITTNELSRTYINVIQSFTTVAELFNEYGCLIGRKTFNVNIKNQSVSNFTVHLCPGESYDFAVIAGTTFIIEPMTGVTNVTSSGATITPPPGGQQYLIYTKDANGDCYVSTLDISYYNLPVSVPEIHILCEGECAEIQVNCLDQYANNVVWQDGYVGSTRTICPNDPYEFYQYDCYAGTCLLENHDIQIYNYPKNIVDHGIDPTPILLCPDEPLSLPLKCPDGLGTTSVWYDEFGNIVPTGANGLPSNIPSTFNGPKKFTRVVTGPGPCDTCTESYLISEGQGEGPGGQWIVDVAETILGLEDNFDCEHQSGFPVHQFSKCDPCVTFQMPAQFNTILQYNVNCQWTRLVRNQPGDGFPGNFHFENSTAAMQGFSFDPVTGNITVCFSQLILNPLTTGPCANGVSFCYRCDGTSGCEDAEEVCFNFFVKDGPCKKGSSGITSTNDINVNEPFVNIYPNPSTGVFTLELTNYDLPNTTYTVVDAVGREVMKVENIDSEKSAIDMSRFEKGIYFIRVNQNGAIETKKIIIQ